MQFWKLKDIQMEMEEFKEWVCCVRTVEWLCVLIITHDPITRAAWPAAVDLNSASQNSIVRSM